MAAEVFQESYSWFCLPLAVKWNSKTKCDTYLTLGSRPEEYYSQSGTKSIATITKKDLSS